MNHLSSNPCSWTFVKKRCPADLLIPFAGTIGQDLCLGVTVTAALKFVTSLPSLVWAQKAYKSTIIEYSIGNGLIM